jgi:ATP-dependent Lon protease
LDPEQNVEFRDHYLDVPFDLSQVFFITTANWTDTIPQPLLDRMEVIILTSYTEEEKVKIAKGYLVPRQMRENGLHAGEIEFGEDALQRIAREYTREAGVRSMERQIGAICRKVATKVAEGGDCIGPVNITSEKVAEYLGRPKSSPRRSRAQEEIPGIATGLPLPLSGRHHVL